MKKETDKGKRKAEGREENGMKGRLQMLLALSIISGQIAKISGSDIVSTCVRTCVRARWTVGGVRR